MCKLVKTTTTNVAKALEAMAPVMGKDVKVRIDFLTTPTKKEGAFKAMMVACDGKAKIKVAFPYAPEKAGAFKEGEKLYARVIVDLKQFKENISVLTNVASGLTMEVDKTLKLVCGTGTYIEMPVAEAVNADFATNDEAIMQMTLCTSELQKALSKGGYLAKSKQGESMFPASENVTFVAESDTELSVYSVTENTSMTASAKATLGKFAKAEGAKTSFAVSGELIRKIVGSAGGKVVNIAVGKKMMNVFIGNTITSVLLSANEIKGAQLKSIKDLMSGDSIASAFVSKEDLINSLSVVNLGAKKAQVSTGEDVMVLCAGTSSKSSVPAIWRGDGEVMANYSISAMKEAIYSLTGDLKISFVEVDENQLLRVEQLLESKEEGEEDIEITAKEVCKKSVSVVLPIVDEVKADETSDTDTETDEESVEE